MKQFVHERGIARKMMGLLRTHPCPNQFRPSGLGRARPSSTTNSKPKPASTKVCARTSITYGVRRRVSILNGLCLGFDRFREWSRSRCQSHSHSVGIRARHQSRRVLFHFETAKGSNGLSSMHSSKTQMFRKSTVRKLSKTRPRMHFKTPQAVGLRPLPNQENPM